MNSDEMLKMVINEQNKLVINHLASLAEQNDETYWSHI
jgi:hypothetical protein